MAFIDTGTACVSLGGNGAASPVVYLIDSSDHPLDEVIGTTARQVSRVTLPIHAWGDALTPWPAPGLYRGEPDFGGRAAETLDELLHEVIPQIEAREGLSPIARAICGYSLGGLFSLYAFTHCDAFLACGCLSGSVWYEGWVPYLSDLELDLAGRFAFLSVGTKEKRGGTPLMRTVQHCMEQ